MDDWTMAIIGSYLGATLNMFTDLGLNDWRFWAILIPTIILIQIHTSIKLFKDKNGN
jgi:hypothetical protein